MKPIEQQLMLHEGLRLKPYRCPAGKLTIGVGRNLEDRGISEKEALFLLANDIEDVIKQLERYSWYTGLDPVRQKVIIDMSFMGMGSLLGFKKMIAALELGNYERASKEMLDSRWATQVGTRATRLSRMMETGEDY